jgi:hypothetical protein
MRDGGGNAGGVRRLERDDRPRVRTREVERVISPDVNRWKR